MGIIENGSISGVLPSNSDTFAVNYPGYPSSIDRAIETLGGNNGILKVRTDKENKLELRFRPEDPFSHPAFGVLRPCNNFLLKISKKKVKNINGVSEISVNQNSEVPEQAETTQAIGEVELQKNNGFQEQLCADIVARVSQTYHFNGMVDYQHVLAVHADVNRRKKRNWDEVEPQYEKGGLLDIDQDDLMTLVPPLFSIKDLPGEVVLKPWVDPCSKKKHEEVVHQKPKMEIEQCLAIDFNIKDIPKKVNWEDSTPSDSDQWRWQMAVCELFDQCPIWVKSSVAEHLLAQGLNITDYTLRRLLYIAAYYFSNGPYRRFYIRKGYDPRKDPESRIYQTIDFRVPPSIRSYCDTALGLTHKWEDICAFRVFPNKFQIALQLFELKDDYIQEEIKKPTSQENCSLQTGWFSPHMIDSFRLRVCQRFLSLCPEDDAGPLLKSVSSRFEKSKRPRLNMNDSKVDGELKQANKEVLESEDKETHDEVEFDEEDEDEMEDDNLEEDMEADEMVDQDTDFALQTDSYTDHENISKDYLRDLFGSFPFGGGGGDEMKNPDPYGGEYQIYEHYSDDNYSDDEEY